MKLYYTLLLTATIFVTTTFVSAQEKEPKKRPGEVPIAIPCDSRENIFPILKNNKESLLVNGTGILKSALNGLNYPSRFGLFVNQDTGAFSVLVMFRDGLTCLLFPGANFEAYTGEEPWDLLEKELQKNEDLQKNE